MTLKEKLSQRKIVQFNSGIKGGTEVTLNLSSNLIGNSNGETNFPQKLLLTDTQVSKIRKAFANGLSANIKFSKTQMSKMIQSGGILRELLVAIPHGVLKVRKQELINKLEMQQDILFIKI